MPAQLKIQVISTYIQYQHDGNRRASVSQLWTNVKNFSRYDHIIMQCGRRPNKQLSVRSSRRRMLALSDSAHAELPAEMALSLVQNRKSRAELIQSVRNQSPFVHDCCNGHCGPTKCESPYLTATQANLRRFFYIFCIVLAARECCMQRQSLNCSNDFVNIDKLNSDILKWHQQIMMLIYNVISKTLLK